MDKAKEQRINELARKLTKLNIAFNMLLLRQTAEEFAESFFTLADNKMKVDNEESEDALIQNVVSGTTLAIAVRSLIDPLIESLNDEKFGEICEYTENKIDEMHKKMASVSFGNDTIN